MTLLFVIALNMTLGIDPSRADHKSNRKEEEELLLSFSSSKLLDLINNQRVGKDIHETFHRQLDDQSDKFGVIAEFLGRRLFDKVSGWSEQNRSLTLEILFLLGIDRSFIACCWWFPSIAFFYY